jgi:hypothetical protein
MLAILNDPCTLQITIVVLNCAARNVEMQPCAHAHMSLSVGTEFEAAHAHMSASVSTEVEAFTV